MSKKPKDDALVIEYKALGTMPIDELAHAIIEDIQALKDNYNVHFISDVRLRIPVTNEYGESLRVTRPGGWTVFRIDAHHYRPACLDYNNLGRTKRF